MRGRGPLPRWSLRRASCAIPSTSPGSARFCNGWLMRMRSADGGAGWASAPRELPRAVADLAQARREDLDVELAAPAVHAVDRFVVGCVEAGAATGLQERVDGADRVDRLLRSRAIGDGLRFADR